MKQGNPDRDKTKAKIKIFEAILKHENCFCIFCIFNSLIGIYFASFASKYFKNPHFAAFASFASPVATLEKWSKITKKKKPFLKMARLSRKLLNFQARENWLMQLFHEELLWISDSQERREIIFDEKSYLGGALSLYGISIKCSLSRFLSQRTWLLV